MNGAATTIATSSVVPPMRRTTTGMKAMRTVTKAPAQTALNRSIRKLRRTRAGSQFGSVTARKLTGAAPLRHRLARLGAAFGTGSIASRPRTVAAARPVPAVAGSTTRSRADSAAARPALPEGPAGTGRGRADHDASVRLHAHGFGLQALLALHGEMHDAPFVREHRLERHGLTARAHARSDALRDLPQLVLAAAAVSLDVDGNVHRPPDLLRGDRADDLLQRDEILSAAPDERSEVRADHVDALKSGTILERHLGLDTHRLEQFAQHTRAQRELLRECGRYLFTFLVAHASRGVGAARDLRLVDHRLGLGRPLVFLERQQHARILAAHAQYVRGLALLEDLDVDVGAFATERPQPPLDGLFHATAGEFLTAKRTHRFPLLRPRRRPPPGAPVVAVVSSLSSESSASLSFISLRASAIAACSRRWSSRSAGVGTPRRNGRYFGNCPQPLTKYCCTIWNSVVAIQ